MKLIYMYKHKVLEHENEDVDFEMEITGVFKDALSWQADEAMRITKRKNVELLNSKSEFNHPLTARIVVQKSNKKLENKLALACDNLELYSLI